ncbi:hypothetical protein C8Q79DRAFT_924847 [Trametes meyenii]|nr:hypothetical protein C8Q79DRAFT_924847 [Trametes meyenii]
MSTLVPPESIAAIFSHVWRSVNIVSEAVSSATTLWAEGYSESSSTGSPQVAKRCARLEAEIDRLRRRLHTELCVLPIVKDSDAGGLTCEFVLFPKQDPRRESPTTTQPQSVLPATIGQPEQGVEEISVAESEPAIIVDDGAQDHVRTESSQVVDPEDDEEAWVAGVLFDADEEDFVQSPSVDILPLEDVVLQVVANVSPSPTCMDVDGQSGGVCITARDIEEADGHVEEVEEEIHENDDRSLDAVVVPVVVMGRLAIEDMVVSEDEDDNRDDTELEGGECQVVDTEAEEGEVVDQSDLTTPPLLSLDTIYEEVHTFSDEPTTEVWSRNLTVSTGALVKRPCDRSLVRPRVVAEVDVDIVDFPSSLLASRGFEQSLLPPVLRDLADRSPRAFAPYPLGIAILRLLIIGGSPY